MSKAGPIFLLLALSALGLGPGATPAGAASSGYLAGAATVAVNPSYPVYMGGFGGGPAGGTLARHVDPLTGKPEQFTARALVSTRLPPCRGSGRIPSTRSPT